MNMPNHESIVHWPGFNEPYHPLWPEETLREWVKKNMGTEEQLKRYLADINWYEIERNIASGEETINHTKTEQSQSINNPFNQLGENEMPVTQTTDEIFANRWLKADDIPNDGDLILTISDCNIEPLGEKKEAKLILMFRENPKQLAVNKTNGKTITDIFGKDPNAWIGKRIALYSTEVEFAGKTMLGIRVRLRPPAEKPSRSQDEILTELGYDF